MSTIRISEYVDVNVRLPDIIEQVVSEGMVEELLALLANECNFTNYFLDHPEATASSPTLREAYAALSKASEVNP